MPNAIFFYFLFNNFYQKSYKPSDDKRKMENKCAKIAADAVNDDSNNNDKNNNDVSKSQDSKKELNKKQS